MLPVGKLLQDRFQFGIFRSGNNTQHRATTTQNRVGFTSVRASYIAAAEHCQYHENRQQTTNKAPFHFHSETPSFANIRILQSKYFLQLQQPIIFYNASCKICYLSKVKDMYIWSSMWMEGIEEASKRDASGSDLECSPAPKRRLYCRTATFYFLIALLVAYL